MKNVFKKLSTLLCTLMWGYIFVAGNSFVNAENINTGEIIITEIHSEEEYIELKNISDETLDVNGYKYSEETSAGIEKIYEFPDKNRNIFSGDFFVINLKRKINNSGDIIKIYTHDNQKISEIIVPKTKSGKSYSLINGIWLWKPPTKGKENIETESKDIIPFSEAIEEEEDSSANSTHLSLLQGLIISEILPNPIGIDSESEFIELYNSSEKSLSLDMFFLEDISGKKFFLSKLSDNQKILTPNTYISLPYSQTKITLNNSNETIFLKNLEIPEDKKENIISTVFFVGSAPEGQSLAEFSGRYNWTTNPTKGSKNVLPLANNRADSSEIQDVELFHIDYSSPSKKKKKRRNNSPMILKISKVFPSSRPDRIDVLCVECNDSLGGIRLGVNGEVFQIPEKTSLYAEIFGKTGDILSFEFQNISSVERKKQEKMGYDFSKKVEKTPIGWRFFVPVSGLTATDENIYLGTEEGKIIDSVFYSNKNGFFSSSKKEVLDEIISQGAWKGKAREFSGVSTVAMKSGASGSFLKRRIISFESGKLQDTNTQNDFFRGFLTDDIQFNFPEKTIKNSYKLQFSQFIFSSEKLEISIENTSNDFVVLSDYFLSNKEKFLLRLDEDQKILRPHQKLIITFPEKKLKTLRKRTGIHSWKNADIFLEIRDRNLEISDVFCFESSKKSGKFRSNRYHMHLLQSPLQKECFYLPEENEVLFKRTYYGLPISLASYSSENIKNTQDSPISQNFQQNLFPKKHSYDNKQKFSEILLEDDSFFIEPPFSTEEVQRKIKQEFPIVFSRVLPNPKGKDSLLGAEKIFLKNTSSHSVFLRNFSLQTLTRKTGKKLPFISFLPYEEREVIFFSGFSLKNSNNELRLLSPENIVIDVIAWEKAREGEFFGKFAPPYRKAIKMNPEIRSKIKQISREIKSSPLSSSSARKISEQEEKTGKKLNQFIFQNSLLEESIENIKSENSENSGISPYKIFSMNFLFFILGILLIFSGIFGYIGFFLYKKTYVKA